jgi:hypothetical protein
MPEVGRQAAVNTAAVVGVRMQFTRVLSFVLRSAGGVSSDVNDSA